MTIQLIDTVTPDVGLKTVADKLNANFTNADHAASKLVGTASDEVPLNSDLPAFGTAATANTGLLTGNVPTADQLSMVGETVNYTGANYQPEVSGGFGVVRRLYVNAGADVSDQVTVAAGNLRAYVTDAAGNITLSGTLTGTYLNVSGGSIALGRSGEFVRIA